MMISTNAQLDESWAHSVSVDWPTDRAPDCFTSLPVRINKYDDIMNLHSTKATNDLAAAMCDDAVHQLGPLGSFSEVGNVASFFYPESLPEKAGIVAYFTQLFCIYDGMSDTIISDSLTTSGS
jgi:hypothetical protein